MLKTVRTTWLLVGAWLIAPVAGLSAQQLQSTTINFWPNTAYYLGYAFFDAKVDGQIRITAGDSYTLHLNGDEIGADSDPSTVETYDVSFKKKENVIAVVVQYSGTQPDYGLFLTLDAEDKQIVSSPVDRLTPWFWTDFALPNEDGAKWTKLKLNKLAKHEVGDDKVTWLPVQAGSLEPRTFAEDFADLDLTRAQSLAGFPGGLDGSQGTLQLRSLRGVNLAYNTSSGDPKLIDGNVNTPKTFRKGVSAVGQRVDLDLVRLFPIKRVRVITQPPSKLTYEDHSLRGYSVLVSKDGVNYLDVGSRNMIKSFQESDVEFPTIPARHVRIQITEFANRNSSPRVGEIEVFGEGVGWGGSYLSPALNLGTDDAKDFDRVIRYGAVTSDADLELRFRSGDDGENWSKWSPWTSDTEIQPHVPEPRVFLQFQVRMETGSLFEGPRLDKLEMFFNSESLAASLATAAVTPLAVPIGVDTTFTYRLGIDFGAADKGVERLVIMTPWPAELHERGIEGLGDVAVDWSATNDSLVIAFNPPLTSNTELVIPFTTRLLSGTHAFQGLLFAPESSSSLLVQPREGTDPDTEVDYSLTAEATDFSLPILADVKAHPQVFSPNGDNINDYVVLGFTLGRVAAAEVRFEIFDLSGRILRTLVGHQLNAGLYAPVEANPMIQLPGRWDGKTDGGELVPPGIYLYRVVVDLDPDEEVASGVVGVAY